MDKFEILEKYDAEFVRCSNGQQVWELKSFSKAQAALTDFNGDALPYNWCPIQQPNGPSSVRWGYRNPQIVIVKEN